MRSLQRSQIENDFIPLPSSKCDRSAGFTCQIGLQLVTKVQHEHKPLDAPESIPMLFFPPKEEDQVDELLTFHKNPPLLCDSGLTGIPPRPGLSQMSPVMPPRAHLLPARWHPVLVDAPLRSTGPGSTQSHGFSDFFGGKHDRSTSVLLCKMRR